MTEWSTHYDDPPDPKRWRTLTNQQRCRLVDQLFIIHQRLLPVLREFERIAWGVREAEKRIPCGLALLGEPGVGKTALAQRWMEQDLAQQKASREAEQLPYLYVNLPLIPTPKALLTVCLAACKAPHWENDTTWNMEQRLQNMIKASHVQLMVIDTMQHLVQHRSERMVSACLDLLEGILTATGTSAIFISRTETADILLYGSRHLKRYIERVLYDAIPNVV